MNPIDQKLFDSYCDPILQKAESFDETSLRNLFDSIKLEDTAQNVLLDALAGLHYQWSLDAFALGLHLGLSLHSDVRRGRPQQVQ